MSKSEFRSQARPRDSGHCRPNHIIGVRLVHTVVESGALLRHHFDAIIALMRGWMAFPSPVLPLYAPT